MVKAVRSLKEIDGYQHVQDIACLSHGLNLVVKALLSPFTASLDEIYLPLKQLLKKPGALRSRSQKRIPGLYSNVKVNPTRWSGWMESIPFIFHHHFQILAFLDEEMGYTTKLRTKQRIQKVRAVLSQWISILTLKVFLKNVATLLII